MVFVVRFRQPIVCRDTPDRSLVMTAAVVEAIRVRRTGGPSVLGTVTS